MNRKKVFLLFVLVFVFSSCSIKKMAFNNIADSLAPSYQQKEKEALRVQKLREQGVEVPNPMLAFLGEEDTELVGSVFPVVIKTYEMMMLQDKTHKGLSLMTGEFYVMYANAFVETPATFLPDTEYDKKNEGFVRARKLYLKGHDLILNSLDLSIRGIKQVLKGNDEKAIDEILEKCTIEDIEALYWAGASSLAVFALEPLNTETSHLVYAGKAMLEKVCALDESFNNGAAWEILAKFYAAAPESLGGGEEKAKNAYNKALELSKGKSASVYVTYASSFCIPKQDSVGFDEAIEKALTIDSSLQPENRLMISLSQNYARWLKAHKDDFILGN
ncbi:MAG: TRAP transporter TatT component family protein [Treponema sp.]